MAGFALRYDQSADERRLVDRIRQIAERFEDLEVYLFGSRAGEHYLDVSDWDLIFVSPDFANVPFLRRGADIAWELSEASVGAVEVLCYTPEELREKALEPTAIGSAVRGARRLL